MIDVSAAAIPRHFRVLLAISCAVLSSNAASAVTPSDADSVTISGTWKIALDPDDEGRAVLDRQRPGGIDEIWLPGSVQAAGFGDPPGPDSEWVGNVREQEWARPEYEPYRSAENFKMPFWLQPDHVYTGAVWFRREVHVPEAFRGRHVALHLERVHWVSEAWLNGNRLGRQESLSTPHIHDLGIIEPGRHVIDLRVDNRMAYEVGPNAHSVTDHTQTNWNGVVGAMELRAEPGVSIEQVRVTPNAAERTAMIEVTLRNKTAAAHTVDLEAIATTAEAPTAETSHTARVPSGRTVTTRFHLDLGQDAAMWDEFGPNTYQLAVHAAGSTGTDAEHTWFGLRDLSKIGTRFAVNGAPIFLRGTLECAIFPNTGYPPTDVPAWEHIFDRMKAFGLNHLRFHSWCPPRAAFIAADAAGMYLQVEGPFWVNQGPALGLGAPIDQYVMHETEQILAEFGNHPSFLLMAYGNEPGGQDRGASFLADWLEHFKEADPRRLYTSGSGWPLIAESQYHVPYQPRIQRWGEGLSSTINSKVPSTKRDYDDYVLSFDVPVVAHEIGQWCVFPDFNEMGKYRGHLKPKNFEVFRDLLQNNNLAHRSNDFLMDSGALQVLCYKEEIEAALRTEGFGGFQLLDLHDFPGQGTALVGVLDPFWDPKPYVDADQYRSFCGPVTPLARFEGRVYADGDTFEALIQVAQFGPRDYSGAEVAWTFTTADGRELASGVFNDSQLPRGALADVGMVRVPLSVETPTRATLTVSIADAGAANAWDIWLYPTDTPAAAPARVHVTSELDRETEDVLAAGGSVLFLPDPSLTKGGVAFGFSPVFWNTAWTDMQPPHTLGVSVDPQHAMFKSFPTTSHTDWHMWDLIGWPGAQASAMVLTGFPADLQPVVQPIDTWFRSRKLASVFEARIGPGKILVSTIDLATDLSERHAARQLRTSVMSYLASEDFDPAEEVSIDAIRSLFRDPGVIEKLDVSVGAVSSFERGYEASNAFDGDPSTMWHSRWSGSAQRYPHSITLNFGKPAMVSAFRYTPRQDGNRNGVIADFAIEVKPRSSAPWVRVASGRFERGSLTQQIDLDQPRRVESVRLVAISAQNGASFAAVSELVPVLAAEGN